VIIIGVILSVVGGIRLSAPQDPGLAAALAAALAVAVVTYGIASARPFHRRPWRIAWTGIGLGLFCLVGAAVVQMLHVGALPGTGPPIVLDAGAAVLAITGLASLLHQRLPGRAVEAVAEAVVVTLSLAFVVLALVVVPLHGWRPTHDLPALAVPLLDLVALWLACSLVSLTDRHPACYRLLIAAFVCLFVAHAAAAALSLARRSPNSAPVDAAALAGTTLWGLVFLHPSRRAAFDPVPLRSMRPSAVKVALLVAMALVVPGVLSAQIVIGRSDRVPALTVGATLLPALVLLYLVHQVFTHAAAEYRAQHDPLTGVCNRLLFEDRLGLSLAQADRNGGSVAVMFLDLDRFKGINDSLGHAVGNQLLQAVVKRLQGCLREQDTLARFGGDEFTLLIPDGRPADESVVRVAERILARFGEPFSVGSRQLSVKASIGVAISPQDGQDAETLLKHADTAMYQAKAAGRNTIEVFDSAMSARARLRFAFEESLRAAVECGRLAVHYQPKLEVATGRIAGVEALARWEHPRLGFIPPWAFIPLAEETSLVATLGQWVLETACVQARHWQQDGLPPVPVAVNLSPRQFGDGSVLAMVTDALHSSGLDPTLLELEITESVLMENRATVAESLRDLRARGVRVAIDDFGTGYNALTYLAEIPVDAIKIDRSFVARIEEGGGASIVGAVIALAHSLDLDVIAEGVETDAQLRFLEGHGCDQVQGFRFSPPVPPAEMSALIESPVRLFTDWKDEVAAMASPNSVVSPARFEALLDSMLQQGHWPAGVDTEAIEAVLAALQPEDLRKVRGARAPKPGAAQPSWRLA